VDFELDNLWKCPHHSGASRRPSVQSPFSFPIVDTHSHVISDDPSAFPPAPMGGKQSEWSRRPLTGDDMLQAMREAGVTQSVLVQACGRRCQIDQVADQRLTR
jgi:hypothetical protein